MSRYSRRPYERDRASKASAIIFAVGVVSMLITVLIFVAVMVPGINRRLENLPLYAQTYYRKLVPHPEFLPTPAPTVSAAGVGGGPGGVVLDLPAVGGNVPPATQSGDVIQASVNIAEEETNPDDQPSDTVVLKSGSSTNLQPVAPRVQLSGFNHQWQTWNNCGPATVTMNMSYFDRTETQVEAAQFLKPNKNDKNVNPQELAAYARTTGLEAIVRQGGSIEQVKQLLTNGLPVLAETWLVHDGDGLGHYRLLTGYDDATGQFTTLDSLNGPDFTVDYAQFDADWRVFNRLYVIVYPPERADVVAAIIGPDMDDTRMYQRLADEAQAEIEANPADAIAHFNQGDALTRLGRFEQAATAFDQSRTLGLHWRRLWYQFTPFEAYYMTGRYQDVIDLTEATIEGTGGLEEAYYYLGLARLATAQTGAKEAFQAAIAYNGNFAPAQRALEQLTP
jgi:tetratricopeptide (TPR) repeat protein